MEMDFVSPLEPLRMNPVYTFKDTSPVEMSVVIRNAVSPWNFHVTDYRTSKCLEDLEMGMTEWYDAYEKGGRHLDELELGGFYAVKYVYEDKPKKWLRCEIVKPFKKDLQSFTCRLVDNGAFYHAPIENFFKLRKTYCSLPIQGIPATLHAFDGSKPGSRHLAAEECRKFYERVEGRHFYAFLLNSAESLKAKGSLRLILVDTSGDRNRYIHEEFNLKLDTTTPT